VAERQNILKLLMIYHIPCRNILGTVQEKCEFPFASFLMHYSVTSKNVLTSDEQQTVAGMKIVFGVNAEVSEIISDVGIIRIPTACTHS
jgi:hypothetical protein